MLMLKEPKIAKKDEVNEPTTAALVSAINRESCVSQHSRKIYSVEMQNVNEDGLGCGAVCFLHLVLHKKANEKNFAPFICCQMQFIAVM